MSFSEDRFGCLAVLNGSSDRAELTYTKQNKKLLVVSIALMRSPRLNASREGFLASKAWHSNMDIFEFYE